MTETVTSILDDKKNTRMALAERVVLLQKYNDGFESENFELGEVKIGLLELLHERDKTIIYLANLIAKGSRND